MSIDFRRKQQRYYHHQGMIRSMLNRSTGCRGCGKEMDLDASYNNRPQLVGVSGGPCLICGQCVKDGRY